MAGDKRALTRQQLEEVAGLFALLSDATRLQILQALRGGRLTVGELVQLLPVKQANVSKQLAALHAAGLLDRQREGLRVWYAIKDPLVFELCELVCGKIHRDAHHKAEQMAHLA